MLTIKCEVLANAPISLCFYISLRLEYFKELGFVEGDAETLVYEAAVTKEDIDMLVVKIEAATQSAFFKRNSQLDKVTYYSYIIGMSVTNKKCFQ